MMISDNADSYHSDNNTQQDTNSTGDPEYVTVKEINTEWSKY